MASEPLTAVTLTLCLAVGIMGQSLILVQFPEFKPAREGQTVELWCGVENSKVSDIDVVWEYLDRRGNVTRLLIDYRNQYVHSNTSDVRFQSTRDVPSNSFTLTITNVKVTNSGFYYCRVHYTNSRGTGSELNVVGSQSPSLVQSPKLINVREGGLARLQCSMQKDDVSKNSIYWYRIHPRQRREWILTHEASGRKTGFTQHFQPFRDTFNNVYILILTNVSVSDAAVYHCCALRFLCGAGTRLNVTSEAVPLLVQSTTLERVTEGRPARLQCSMEKANVISTDVHWYRQLPGQQREWILTHDTSDRITGSESSTQRFQSSRVTSNNTYILILPAVSVSDAAIYHCCVWGDICGDGTRLNLIKQSPGDGQMPYIPVIITVGCLALVLLSIPVTITYMKQLLCFKKKIRENGSLTGQPCNSLRTLGGDAAFGKSMSFQNFPDDCTCTVTV